MKKLVSSLVVTFILVMTLAGGCVRSAADESVGPAASTTLPVASLDDPQELERFLDVLIAERMEEYHIPGEAVAVVRDGKVIFFEACGCADLAERTRCALDDTEWPRTRRMLRDEYERHLSAR